MYVEVQVMGQDFISEVKINVGAFLLVASCTGMGHHSTDFTCCMSIYRILVMRNLFQRSNKYGSSLTVRLLLKCRLWVVLQQILHVVCQLKGDWARLVD